MSRTAPSLAKPIPVKLVVQIITHWSTVSPRGKCDYDSGETWLRIGHICIAECETQPAPSLAACTAWKLDVGKFVLG